MMVVMRMTMRVELMMIYLFNVLMFRQRANEIEPLINPLYHIILNSFRVNSMFFWKA